MLKLPISGTNTRQTFHGTFRSSTFEEQSHISVQQQMDYKRHLCNAADPKNRHFSIVSGSGATAYLDTFRTKCVEGAEGGGLEKERGIPPGSGPEAQLSSVAARTAARFLADAGSPGQFAR